MERAAPAVIAHNLLVQANARAPLHRLAQHMDARVGADAHGRVVRWSRMSIHRPVLTPKRPAA